MWAEVMCATWRLSSQWYLVLTLILFAGRAMAIIRARLEVTWYEESRPTCHLQIVGRQRNKCPSYRSQCIFRSFCYSSLANPLPSPLCVLWHSESVWVGEHIYVPGGWSTSSRRTEAPTLGTLLDLSSCTSSSGVPLHPLSDSLSLNKPVIISKDFPGFCEPS